MQCSTAVACTAQLPKANGLYVTKAVSSFKRFLAQPVLRKYISCFNTFPPLIESWTSSDFLFVSSKNDVQLSRNLPAMLRFHNFTIILLRLSTFQWQFSTRVKAVKSTGFTTKSIFYLKQKAWYGNDLAATRVISTTLRHKVLFPAKLSFMCCLIYS